MTWGALTTGSPWVCYQATFNKSASCIVTLVAIIDWYLIVFPRVPTQQYGFCLRCRADQLSLQWRHNEHDSVSNHQPHDCLLNRLFRRRSKKTSKLRVTSHCLGNSPGTGEFPAQMASNAENVSIWWRHHGRSIELYPIPGILLCYFGMKS